MFNLQKKSMRQQINLSYLPVPPLVPAKTSPCSFSMMHLFHLLYGVDAPGVSHCIVKLTIPSSSGLLDAPYLFVFYIADILVMLPMTWCDW